MKPERWMRGNLATQGYCLTDAERRQLWLGLRFPTAVCLALVVTGLALESALMIALLVPIGAVAGWSSRHPFDYIWNGAVRHLARGPQLPTNPVRRRHSFKLATVWLAGVAVLFAAGESTAGLVFGVVLVAVCSIVTLINFCIPSMVFAWLERRGRREVPA